MKHRTLNIWLWAGGLLQLIFILMAICPQIFTDYVPKEMFGAWEEPSSAHILGTGALGYDIFTEMVYGAGETLFIGVISSIITLFLGATIGILAAQKGKTGQFFQGIIQIFVLLPRLVTLIVLGSFVGNSARNLIVLISTFSWVGTARAVQAKVSHINSQMFIENCVIQGYDKKHIIFYHILPNLYDVLISRFLLGINGCIMMESTLSFLGFGDLYYPTWGTMINFAYKRGAFIRHAYGYLIAPGVCIMLVSLSFYFISTYFENRKAIMKE